MKEHEWVEAILPRFRHLCSRLSTNDVAVDASADKKLAYLHEIRRYSDSGTLTGPVSHYATDLMISDHYSDGSWTPRIVIECKYGKVTTHDALTYSAKAATHKRVHSYIRYGILIGCWGNYALPARLIRHGEQFDFMATWCLKDPDDVEWLRMSEVITEELATSRYLQNLFASKRHKEHSSIRFVHRPFVAR